MAWNAINSGSKLDFAPSAVLVMHSTTIESSCGTEDEEV
jgi:ammonia channel protein AmtB